MLQLEIVYMAAPRLVLRLHGNKKGCPTRLLMIIVKVVHMVRAMVRKVQEKK